MKRSWLGMGQTVGTGCGFHVLCGYRTDIKKHGTAISSVHLLQLLGDQVSKHEAGTRVCVVQEGLDLGPDAVKHSLTKAPAEDEEAHEELEAEAPEDVAPDDMAWVGGEQEAEQDNHPDAQVGDKPPVLPRHACVIDDEYFKDENEAQCEEEPTVAPVSKRDEVDFVKSYKSEKDLKSS